jgi:SAM-dependent methyltransferase
MTSNQYKDGQYLQKTGGTWHREDSPFKAGEVLRMLDRSGLRPKTICEVGCGAGGILAELRKSLPAETELVGYEISPQAHELSKPSAGGNLSFLLADPFEDVATFDLVLVMDVIEHVEDTFAFLRKCRRKGAHKLYHIPLDVTCLSAIRDSPLTSWRQLGHLHCFSVGTALEALRYTDHRILDHFLTASALAARGGLKRKIANAGRLLLGKLSRKLSQRIWGGYSLMVLCE